MAQADLANELICGQKTFTYMGCGEVVMPENYIAMFNAPERVEAVKIIKNADVLIKYIVGYQCPL